MQIFEEELLEPLARWLRFRQGFAHFPSNKSLTLVDLGCGPELRFYYYAQQNGALLKEYIGIDPLISKQQLEKHHQTKNIQIINKPLQKKIACKSGTADVVTAFAFFEHITHPREILAEAYRLLKPGGKLILTVPSPRAQVVLEFFAFKLGIISKREIAEHQQYFDRDGLLNLLPAKVKRSQVHHHYFEWGMNNLLVVKK